MAWSQAMPPATLGGVGDGPAAAPGVGRSSAKSRTRSNVEVDEIMASSLRDEIAHGVTGAGEVGGSGLARRHGFAVGVGGLDGGIALPGIGDSELFEGSGLECGIGLMETQELDQRRIGDVLLGDGGIVGVGGALLAQFESRDGAVDLRLQATEVAEVGQGVLGEAIGHLDAGGTRKMDGTA